MSETDGQNEPIGTLGAPQITVSNQYIKDLSFENPNAPQSLLAGTAPPQIAVNVDVQVRRLGDTLFEAALRLSATAKQGEQTNFVVELVYAGVFVLNNIPPEHLEGVLLVECPRLLFPFARRIIADATRDGGFPPLMLDPIDFMDLYRRSRAEREAAALGTPVGTA